MSNLDTSRVEMVGSGDGGDASMRGQLLEPREVPLGGPRAMTVRRTLPQRARSLVGAWCFADHYGPDDVSATGGMRVPGHPHTGLQTVSWLFSGEVEHRDTLGTHSFVRPGEINLMTAGSGIAHSEYSTPDTTVLHGAQLWVALPEADRFAAPAFEYHAPPALEQDGARVLVFLGSLLGYTSPVATYTPLLGAEITLGAGQRLHLDIEPSFEHGVLVDTGTVTASGVTAGPANMIYQPTGSRQLIVAAAQRQARVLLLGGEPFGEQIVMWWNLIGRSHEEIIDYRQQWQDERVAAGAAGHGRFGRFPEQWENTLPAPEPPNTRLRLRG